MKNVKLNTLCLAGNISQVDIKQGQHGLFGTVTIAIDDGYFQKATQPNQDGQWVDRSYFIDCKVNQNNLKSLYTDLIVGDQLVIEGKLIQETWVDPNNNNRSALKVDVAKIVSHLPRALIDLGKANGLIPTNQNAGQQNQNRQGKPSNEPRQSAQQQGYQSMPQRNSGSFRQPQFTQRQ